MTKFGERMLQAARHAGVREAQSSIAADLGLKKQTVHHWFTKGEPTAENLAIIEKRWGIDGEWLRSGEGQMLPETDGLTNDERDLIKSYRMAPANVRSVIRSMARAARKSMIAIALGIPPLLASQPSDASALHNLLRVDFASTICIVARRLRSWLSVLSQGPVFA